MGSDRLAGRLVRSAAAALLAVSVSLAGAPALAQSDADRATARQLAQEGQDALRAKDYATAVDRFARADRLFHAPTLLLGLARAQAGQGKLVAAHETYRTLLRETIPADAPAAYAKAVEAAQAEVAALAPRIAYVTITVEGGVQPRATLDGFALSPAAWGVKRPIDPGKHVVRAGDYGFKPVEVKFEIAEGATLTVPMQLVAAPSGSPAWGYPAVTTTPAAPAPAPPPRPSSAMKITGIVITGLGVAGLAAGAITGAMALGDAGTLSDQCNADLVCPGSERDTVSSYRTLSTTSTATFIAGGVLTAGGVALILAAPSSKPAAGQETSPGAAKGALSLSIGPGSIVARGAF